MALPEDVFPADECCEICGIRLNDEVVIQEFADGSLARLCPECAAGAAFNSDSSQALERFPDDEEDGPPAFPADADPLEMTRELLVPVTDLISLQTEMQAALERLAASLERFATGVIVDTKDRTADVDSRFRSLEDELERTRTRLREAESLLVATSTPAPEAAASGTTVSPGPILPAVPLPVDEFATGVDLRQALPADEEWPPLSGQATGPIDLPAGPVLQSSVIVPPPAEPAPAAVQGHGETFSLGEIQLAQRYFNESPFTERVRDVRHSLGKPKINVSRIQGPEPRVLITVLWDIVWYQYLVNLRKEAPVDERVALFREGMDLDELAPHFRDKNASVDDDGRLDASELEVRLLSDPTVLITEMDADEERALEDATEEIWDQHIAPEFKWDD